MIVISRHPQHSHVVAEAGLSSGDSRYLPSQSPTSTPTGYVVFNFLLKVAVDAKRGYVGMCNGGSAQQESGAGLSKNSMFTAGAKNYIQLLY